MSTRKSPALQRLAHHAAVALVKPSSAQAPPASPASLPTCIATLLMESCFSTHDTMQTSREAIIMLMMAADSGTHPAWNYARGSCRTTGIRHVICTSDASGLPPAGKL